MATAYLSLGTNLGDRARNLISALEEIARLPASRTVRVSSVYETEPVLPPSVPPQHEYLNLVAEIETGLSPEDLLSRLLAIESRLGRTRREKNESRIIDIDLLLYDERILNRDPLSLPHPRIAERRFVLAPLHELAPGLRHPVLRKTVAELLAGAPDNHKIRKTSLKMEVKEG